MVDVWILGRPPAGVGQMVERAASAVLARAERARERSFSGAGERAEYRAFRVGLRAILAAIRPELGEGLALSYGPHGKPFLEDGPEFSFSATTGLALVAVSLCGPVGVDVERVRDIAPARAGLAGAPGLAAFLDRAEQGAHGPDIAFLKAWTRLEASLKRAGEALGPALGELRQSNLAAGRGFGRGPAPGACEISDIDAPHGFVGACAHAPGELLDVRTFDWAEWRRSEGGREISASG